MTGFDFNDPVGRDDVFCLYVIFLGRHPERTAGPQAIVGLPFSAAMQGFLMSTELVQLAGEALAEQTLTRHQGLASPDFVRAANWVSQRLNIFVPGDITRWWLLLDVIYRLDCLQEVIGESELAKFRALLAHKAKVEQETLREIQKFLQVDHGWLARHNARAALAAQRGSGGSFEAYFLANGLRTGAQLLPAFSENLDKAYRGLRFQSEVAIGDVVAETYKGLREGTVSHWLFDAGHYLRVLDRFSDADRREVNLLDKSKSPYFDYLTYGDANGYGPHPLFCPQFYRRARGSSLAKTSSPFLDYLTEGCFEDRPTSAVFDADYYLRFNPSAAAAMHDGAHVSALHHFLTVGIFQDLPFSPDFDPTFYAERHPDVAALAQARTMPSLSWHFVFHGLEEGRDPNPYFQPAYYRTRHPHVPGEMRRLGIASELEHFLMIGKERGYQPSEPLIAGIPAARDTKAVFQRRALRSLNNIRRRPLDFGACKGPPGAAPRVSMIVPVCNEVAFTSRFLECAYFAAIHLKATTGLTCEIVIVDNGSTDATAQVVAACKGIVSVAFDRPIGFPRAVNEGVRRSSGAVIVVANNDIAFMPDVLVTIERRLESDPDIGVLGGLTILPNETLQEAGSFLDRGASVVGLGREENPWDAFFQGVHGADYCTGSFIAFRRDDFDRVGGFDEAFSPGYYEETDFTFRLAKATGKRAAVDSDIQISHFEHATFGKGRPPTTAFAQIKRNQARFLERHGEALRDHPSWLQLFTSEGRARPTALARLRLLVIEDLIPDSRLGSGFGRTARLLESLTERGIAFDLLALSPNAIVDQFADPRVNVHRGWMPGSEPEAFLARHGQRYSHILVCRTHNIRRFAGPLEQLRHQHGIRILCDTEALGALRLVEMRRMAGRAIGAEEERAAIRAELDVPVQVGLWIAVSAYEAAKMRAAGTEPVSVIGYRFEAQVSAGRGRAQVRADVAWAERRRILAVGAVHEPETPNHDGLLWFMERVYPRCAALFRSFRLTLVGHWEAEVRQRFQEAYADVPMEFVGVASERRLATLYDESRLALAPTRFAAGVAIKVLDAIGHGVPIVMTDLLEKQLVGETALGASGLAVAARSDDGAGFAGWIETLCADEAAWNRVRRQQDEILARVAGAEVFERAVDEVFLHKLPKAAKGVA